MSYDPNDPRPMEIQLIRSAVREMHDRRRKAGPEWELPQAPKLFTIRTADQWLQQGKDLQAPKMLFGNFWYEGELCIMFADTNMGKSILAVQIGQSISRNEPIEPFGLEAGGAGVLYVDFELSTRQFNARYSGRQGHFAFNKTFYRAEFNPQTIVPPDYKDYTDYMNWAVEDAIMQTQATVLIIDNITCLRSGTESAGQALSLMQHLKTLIGKRKLSILVLAHTPKRNPSLPIGRNDLHGSKMLINFADSAFAIGESQTQPGYRYLKQIKQRSSAEVYGTNNVCLCRVDDKLGFLRYEFTGNSSEHAHLRSYHRQANNELKARAIQLKNNHMSNRKIAAALHISATTVNRLFRDEG